MADASQARVAVYIDFDNIVISQYDNVHGRSSFMKDKARTASGKVVDLLAQATVNIGAVLDYASSFGAIAVSRAYADWSAPVNARYREQLVDRAVDLVQLFNTARTKNGADIRLSVDVVEELFRLQDITHVVIIAGDSDYIPLAQSIRRLGRTVIGVGIDGSTSPAFKNACDEFSYYHALPGTEVRAPRVEQQEPETPDPQRDARELLIRALQVGRNDDNIDNWLNASALKQQMKRLDSSFDEKALKFKTFTDFVKSADGVVEIKEDGLTRLVRLRDRG